MHQMINPIGRAITLCSCIFTNLIQLVIWKVNLSICSFQEVDLPEKVDVIVSEWMVRSRSLNIN